MQVSPGLTARACQQKLAIEARLNFTAAVSGLPYSLTQEGVAFEHVIDRQAWRPRPLR